MAPKKDAKKDAKGKKGKKEKRGENDPIPSVLENEILQNFGKLVCISLCVISIALGIVCQKEYRKSREVDEAMIKIRTLMTDHDSSLVGKDDTKLLEAAEVLAQHLIDTKTYISLVKKEIEDTNRLIKQGWRIYNRTYWYFTKRQGYQAAIRECQSKDVHPQKILTTDLEQFLETQLERLQSGIWIPMQKRARHKKPNEYDWYWFDGEKVVTPMYWQTGEPNHQINEHCAEIKVPCATPNRCWNDVPCETRNVLFCRGKDVDRRWLLK